jgi:hypothetical protein
LTPPGPAAADSDWARGLTRAARLLSTPGLALLTNRFERRNDILAFGHMVITDAHAV